MNFFRLALALALTFAACSDEDFAKQGEVGEICNGGIDDCRPGLVCDRGACVEADGPTYNCADICAKLSECETAEPGCEADCRITTTTWDFRAREEFGVCIVEDLECRMAQTVDSLQYCYQQVEIPEQRFAVCRAAADATVACDGATPRAERVLESCAAIARVQPDDIWNAAATCASGVETGICSEVGTCFTRN